MITNMLNEESLIHIPNISREGTYGLGSYKKVADLTAADAIALLESETSYRIWNGDNVKFTYMVHVWYFGIAHSSGMGTTLAMATVRALRMLYKKKERLQVFDNF